MPNPTTPFGKKELVAYDGGHRTFAQGIERAIAMMREQGCEPVGFALIGRLPDDEDGAALGCAVGLDTSIPRHPRVIEAIQDTVIDSFQGLVRK